MDWLQLSTTGRNCTVVHMTSIVVTSADVIGSLYEKGRYDCAEQG